MVRVEVRAAGDSGFQICSFVPLTVIRQRHEEAVTVPRVSLMRRENAALSVFVVKDGKLELRPVKSIMVDAGRVEVEGVEPGEKVVTSTFLGWVNLADGLNVEVAK
jgi:multidrug efflux pump subunit AcrA (membrane-fusion protein)